MLSYQNTDLAYSLKGLILLRNFPTARIELDLFVGFLCCFVLKVLKMLTAVSFFPLTKIFSFSCLNFRLGLKDQQEREIVHVVLYCCLQEKTYNPFYAFLASKLCGFERRFQVKKFLLSALYCSETEVGI